MVKRILNYFLRGVILVVPLACTVYVLYAVFVTVDDLIPFEIPGLGLLTVLGLLTLLGWIGGTILAQPFITYFNRLLERVPLIKTLYTSIKDLIDAFVGQKKSFSKAVIVKLHEHSELEKLGFVTAEDLSNIGVSDEKVAVYLPHSYNFSGNLFIVPKKNVRPIPGKSADVMKFIVSGGVSEVPSDKELES